MRNEVDQTITDWKKRYTIIQIINGIVIALFLAAGFFTVHHLFVE